MDDSLTRKKWRNHVSNSKQKSVGHLTLDQYRKKISDAGISPEQIGNSATDYQLGRYTDIGDYTPASCRFITTLENLKEQATNGGTARMVDKKKGRTKENDASVASRSKKMTGRTKETHQGIAIASEKRSVALTGRTKETHAGVATTARKNSKPYSFISPDGDIHSGVNLEQFCRDHGLLGNAMCKLKSGRLKSYHGWKVLRQ